MKHKILKMKSLRYINEGAFGTYYKIANRMVGIKIQDFGYDTKKDALEVMRELNEREYNNLVQAAKRTRMVPRPKGLAIVEDYDSYQNRKMYHVGYMMTHVNGRCLGDSASHKDYDRLEKAEQRMDKLGIELSDNHTYNVMKTKTNRIIFIDAARFYVRPICKKRKTKKRRR